MGWRRADRPHMFAAWAETVGATQAARRADPAAKLVITYGCTICDAQGAVDIDKLVLLKGADYSLVNRRCRCRRTPDCPGWVRFWYSHGRMVPLWDEERAAQWCDAEWTARKAVAAAIHNAGDDRERKRRQQRR